MLDRTPPALADEPRLRDGNAALAAHGFVAGHALLPTYPARLYVTVTEACNLRCRHCITDAPARTASGRARTITPAVLDALAAGFAHADYLGFTHGGEALASPTLDDVLARIAAARTGRAARADVHLASNGTLLTLPRVQALVAGGVTSVMVSLDGATAATSDRIRVLGRFDAVIANLAAAVAWRRGRPGAPRRRRRAALGGGRPRPPPDRRTRTRPAAPGDRPPPAAGPPPRRPARPGPPPPRRPADRSPRPARSR